MTVPKTFSGNLLESDYLEYSSASSSLGRSIPQGWGKEERRPAFSFKKEKKEKKEKFAKRLDTAFQGF